MIIARVAVIAMGSNISHRLPTDRASVRAQACTVSTGTESTPVVVTVDVMLPAPTLFFSLNASHRLLSPPPSGYKSILINRLNN